MAPHHDYHFWDRRAGHNLSWGAVFAGAVTFAAIMLLLSLVGSAIGLTIVNPTADNPVAGLGTGMIIWTIVQLLISLFAGSFVAGLAARRAGMLHGFLSWALSMVLMTAMVLSTAAAGLNLAGNVVGQVLGAAGSAVGVTANKAGELTAAGFDSLGKELGKVDTSELGDKTEQILRDSEVPELQPEYLNEQLSATQEDLKNLAHQLVVDPDNADALVKDFSDKVSGRIDTIKNSVDRDAVAKAVAKNSELSEAEAKEAVDNAIEGLQKTADQAEASLQQVQEQVQQTVQDLQEQFQAARQTAQDVSKQAAVASGLLFVGLLISLCLCAWAGILGSKRTRGTELQA